MNFRANATVGNLTKVEIIKFVKNMSTELTCINKVLQQNQVIIDLWLKIYTLFSIKKGKVMYTCKKCKVKFKKEKFKECPVCGTTVT